MILIFERMICCVLAVTVITIQISAAEFHVTPTGTARGRGSLEKPWDLASALADTTTVRAGDTIWMHAGTYRGGFTSRLNGRPDAPIVVRGVRGERVTIDTHPRDERDNGLLLLAGGDTIYRDFEVTSSDLQRETAISGSWPGDIRRGTVDVRGTRISAINLVVHDLAGGFGFWADGEGGEINGCLIYNNGWNGPDRGHGHAVYAQNSKGTKRIVDNILFHQFGYGIHVYGSEKAALKGFEIEGNFAFNNGCLAKNAVTTPGILVGGLSPAGGIVVRDNVVVGGPIRLGYPWGTTNDDVICTGNYCGEGLVVRDFRRATITRNTVVAASEAVRLEGADKLLLQGQQWDKNDYYVTDGRWGECSVIEGEKRLGLTFADWQRETGFDSQSTLTRGAPDKLRVIVRPNSHEPGRANIAVLNPGLLPEVEIDLSSVLSRGKAFQIVSAKDFFGPALISAVYDGQPVRIPMKAVRPAAPVGLFDAKPPVTEPMFAVFVVLPDA